jgi:Mannosyltransferase (PIG-V)
VSPSATLVLIRGAYLIAIAAAMVWHPVHHGIHPDGAYTPLGDLVFGSLDRWDAGWFIRIARHGYDVPQSAAFFPLYPLLLRGLAFVVRSHTVAGTLLSLASAAFAAEMIYRIARAKLGETGARDSVLLIALYPIAFVFTAVYSDALFLALASGSFYAAMRGRPLASGLAGALAVATRPLGLALLPALVILLWRRRWAGLWPLLLLPASLGLYAFYLHQHFGDAFAFAHAEKTFWLRHTPALGPLQGLWEGAHTAEQGLANLVRHIPARMGYPEGYAKAYAFGIWNLIHFLLLLAAAWLTWVAWKRLGPAFGIYSAASLLIALSSPAEVVPLVSLPRFLLADFPIFIALAALAVGRPRLRESLLVGFGSVGLLAAVAFAHGVWVA